MTEATIIEKVRGYITENFLYMRPGFQLADEDRLIEHRILDSMGVMELVAFLRHEFSIPVPERDIQDTNLGSLRDIAAYVMRAKAPRPA